MNSQPMTDEWCTFLRIVHTVSGHVKHMTCTFSGRRIAGFCNCPRRLPYEGVCKEGVAELAAKLIRTCYAKGDLKAALERDRPDPLDAALDWAVMCGQDPYQIAPVICTTMTTNTRVTLGRDTGVIVELWPDGSYARVQFDAGESEIAGRLLWCPTRWLDVEGA